MSVRRLCTAVLSLLGVLTLVTPTASASTGYHHYVALGDSYTSGPFIPFLRPDPLGCARSTNNYPSQLADRLGLGSHTDVSCGGADSTNMTTAQSVPLGSNRPQFDALTADTDLVTIGIGGNDHGVFGDLTSVCPTLRDSDPTGTPCQQHFTADGVDSMRTRVADTRARVTTVLQQITQRAPKAKVLLVGYPRIVPESGYCPDILPMADGDYRYLDSVERSLNAALADAAATTGTSYVDTYTPSLGHDACASNGDAWINGKDLNLFAALAYHPFRSAMVAEASIIDGVLHGQQPTRAAAERAVRAAGPAPQVADPNAERLAHAMHH